MSWVIKNRSSEPARVVGPGVDVEVQPGKTVEVSTRVGMAHLRGDPETWERVPARETEKR